MDSDPTRARQMTENEIVPKPLRSGRAIPRSNRVLVSSDDGRIVRGSVISWQLNHMLCYDTNDCGTMSSLFVVHLRAGWSAQGLGKI